MMWSTFPPLMGVVRIVGVARRGTTSPPLVGVAKIIPVGTSERIRPKSLVTQSKRQKLQRLKSTGQFSIILYTMYMYYTPCTCTCIIPIANSSMVFILWVYLFILTSYVSEWECMQCYSLTSDYWYDNLIIDTIIFQHLYMYYNYNLYNLSCTIIASPVSVWCMSDQLSKIHACL